MAARVLALVLPMVAPEIARAAGETHPICAAAKIRPTLANGLPCAVWRTDGRNGQPEPVPEALAKPLDWRPPGWEATTFRLLGEVHDNPAHHRWRGRLLGPAAVPGREPALVFEHLRVDQQSALDLYADLARHGRHLDTPAEFFRFVKWDESGWPGRSVFEPLFKSALHQQLPILPGDPARDRIKAVARQGLAALEAAEVRRLRLDQPLDPGLNDALLAELEASHCGLVPKSALAPMAAAQRYRDAHLAEAMVKAVERHGAAILLAGNGHVRVDRGVPHYLRLLAPQGSRMVSILLVEVEARKLDGAAYVARDPSGRPTADYVVITPRVERKDPCAEMRERYGRGRQ